ncbi:MAG: 3'(2'),5'-bisphosphate nucleotidase CysQ [Pseudomonadota bacterium]
MDHPSLIKALVPVALKAGDVIMDIHARGVAADQKIDGSPVTEADQAAERIILKALQETAPNITVVSEENASSHLITAPECFFLVDPLDGTKEFLKADGKGAFTVNIALIEAGVPVLGIVHAPALGRTFTGSQTEGAHENNQPISVRQLPNTGAVAVASASHRDAETDQWLLDHKISQTVSIGSSLKFCLVAAGEADVYPRFGPTMEWDTAAGDAVLRAAGGQVFDRDGTPFRYGKTNYRNGAFVARGTMV